METVEKITPISKPKTSTTIRLVRDGIGGVRLETADNQILENVFVKEYSRLEGSVTRVYLEVIYIAPDHHGKNW